MPLIKATRLTGYQNFFFFFFKCWKKTCLCKKPCLHKQLSCLFIVLLVNASIADNWLETCYFIYLFFYPFFQDHSQLNPLQTLTEEEDAVLYIDEWTTPAD